MEPIPAESPVERGALRRILVIDNSASARKLYAAVLAAPGECEVFAAAGCAEADSILNAQPEIDAVVCDLILDSENGADFIAALRARGSVIPVLVTTVSEDFESMARALEAGADDYLKKPVNLGELRQAVAVLISCFKNEARTRSPYTPVHVQARDLEEGCSFELVAPTNSAQIESFQRFVERLATARVTTAERLNLRLALEEIIQNAREWGNRFDAAKTIRLSCCLLDDRVVVRVEDEGTGFDPKAVPDPSTDPREHVRRRLNSGKRVGGWGLFLTRKMMDDLAFSEKGNVVCITKRFHGGEGF